MSSSKFAHGGIEQVPTIPMSLKNQHSAPSNLSKVGNLENPYTFEVVEECAKFLLNQTHIRPKIAIICGSGLGGLANLLEDRQDFAYENIPHFPVSTVAGHAGKLVIGNMSGVPVLCMQGRFHSYEGYPLWKTSMPVRVFKMMGVEILIVTNAAGGLNQEYKVGDIMLIKDHINFPGMSGDAPQRGPNDERFGQRFFALNKAYDKDLRTLARQVAEELNMSHFMKEGVYSMVGGPMYETIAELRAMKMLGVDAIGMSTIPEVITGVHCGLKVFAFSLITNISVMDYDSKEMANHEEVMETARERQGDLQQFITRLIPAMKQMHLK